MVSGKRSPALAHHVIGRDARELELELGRERRGEPRLPGERDHALDALERDNLLDHRHRHIGRDRKQRHGEAAIGLGERGENRGLVELALGLERLSAGERGVIAAGAGTFARCLAVIGQAKAVLRRHQPRGFGVDVGPLF